VYSWHGRTKLAITVLLVMAVVAVAGCGQQEEGASQEPQQTYELKLATMVTDPHPWIPMAEHFAARVEELTNGGVKVVLYPGGTLGNDQATLEDMRYGTVDFNITTSANASPFVPALQVFSLSYLFKDSEHFRRALAPDSPLVEAIAQEVEKAQPDFKFLALSGGGTRSLSTRFGPVRTPADLKGRRMRVMMSPIESQIWEALGTIPVSVPWTELYTAIQTGVAEAFESSTSGYWSAKLYEVGPYHCLTQHQFMVSVLLMSKKTWDQLPAEYQQAVVKAAEEAAQVGIDKGFEVEAEIHAKLREKNVTIVEVDKESFQAIVVPLHDQFAEDMNVTHLLKIIRDLAGE